MQWLDCQDSFAVWRDQARTLLIHRVPPEGASWQDASAPELFARTDLPPLPDSFTAPRISARVLAMLEQAARFRTPARWNLLYRVLWRVSQGESQAVLAGDVDGSALQARIKAVRREAHHLHAFLRFQPSPVPHLDWVAWYEAAHDILESASPHFIHRLGTQRWLIATPQDGMHCDGERMDYRKACPPEWQQIARGLSTDDPLWQTYYRHIFNPARINEKAMQGHMPKRFWPLLPEGDIIPALISTAHGGARAIGQQRDIAGQKGKTIRPRRHFKAE